MPATKKTARAPLEPINPGRRNTIRVSWFSVLMFLYGAGWSISFDVGVRLYAAELIIVLGLLTVRWGKVFSEYKALRDVLLAYGLWIAAICISDIVNATALIDVARNISTPILGGASLVLLVAVLSREPSAAFAFLIGTIIFKAAFGDATYGDTFADVAVDWTNIEVDTNLFKVRVDPFLTPALIIFCCYLSSRGRYKASAFLGIAAVLYFMLDSRSTALILLLTSLMLLLGSGYRPRLGQVLMASVPALLLLYGAYVLYVNYTFAYNPFGHNGKQLMMLENPYNPVELILRARSEWLVWPIAFAEKPIFGWGSWAADVNGRFEALQFYSLGMDQPGNFINSYKTGYIPVHSLIGAALVWSGLLGLISIIFLLRTIFSLLKCLPSVPRSLLPICSFFGFMTIFHVFFSPPQHVRISFPFALSVLIVATAHVGPMARLRAIRSTNGQRPRQLTVRPRG